MHRTPLPFLVFVDAPDEVGGSDDPKPVDQQREQGDPDALGDPGKRALAAEREARRAAERERDQFRADAEKYRQANETEQQRLQRERDEATSTAAQMAAENARYRAAAEAGLPLSWAPRLVGSTAEELAQDAKSLAEQIGKTAPKAPAPDPSQGHGDSRGGRPASVKQAMEAHRASIRPTT